MSTSPVRDPVRRPCDSTTTELLATVFGVQPATDAATLSAFADALDSGRLGRCAFPPDAEPYAPDLPAGIARRLAGALELARRVGLSAPPATIRGPKDVHSIAARQLGGRTRECVLVIACDSANRVIATEIVSRGSVDRALMPVREVLAWVLRMDGRAFAVGHNHPAELFDSSLADDAAAECLAAAARRIGLRFLGQVVVGFVSASASSMPGWDLSG